MVVVDFLIAVVITTVVEIFTINRSGVLLVFSWFTDRNEFGRPTMNVIQQLRPRYLKYLLMTVTKVLERVQVYLTVVKMFNIIGRGDIVFRSPFSNYAGSGIFQCLLDEMNASGQTSRADGGMRRVMNLTATIVFGNGLVEICQELLPNGWLSSVLSTGGSSLNEG